MRSGNGRHRRPRQAPALVVAAGVTGSAMALPLLATGSASAADATTWDRVAECESGGQWSANFGNGMYGGLQMTQEAWERHGGLAYAPSPDLASRAQQIAVADKALAAGSLDWATCAPIAGLKNDGKATGVNPGPTVAPVEEGGLAPESNRTAGTAAPSAPATSAPATRAPASAVPTSPGVPSSPAAPVAPTAPTTPAAPPTTPSAPGTPADPDAPTAPVAPDASVTPGSPDAAPGDGVSATPGAGKHRGGAAPEETGKSGSSTGSGRHAAPADKLTETPIEAPVTDGAKDSGATDTRGTSDAYTVQPGDSLSEIAQENELAGGWNALYDANRRTVGIDPDLILPGQSLDLTIGSESAAG
ncbi:transglycosylase family protein [Streptomyces sp. NPDC003327]